MTAMNGDDHHSEIVRLAAFIRGAVERELRRREAKKR
jgi:hypothetical protein